MKIGFLGLGKLGLPCALAADSKGHDVFGYDINPHVKDILDTHVLPYREEGAQELIDNHQIAWSSLSDLVTNSEIIFVPIQTPHDARYEGTTRLPNERVDFDYNWLVSGLKSLSEEIDRQSLEKIVIIISVILISI